MSDYLENFIRLRDPEAAQRKKCEIEANLLAIKLEEIAARVIEMFKIMANKPTYAGGSIAINLNDSCIPWRDLITFTFDSNVSFLAKKATHETLIAKLIRLIHKKTNDRLAISQQLCTGGEVYFSMLTIR